MSDNNQTAPRSYEVIEVKEFKSSIPPHLLGKLSDSDRWLVETMSKLENQNNWLVTAILKINKDVLDCDRRISDTRKDVSTLAEWKQIISGKWAVVGVLGLLALSVVFKFLFDALWHLWKP
jgi:hypothetical protein